MIRTATPFRRGRATACCCRRHLILGNGVTAARAGVAGAAAVRQPDPRARCGRRP